jgi:hypothetical protein
METENNFAGVHMGFSTVRTVLGVLRTSTVLYSVHSYEDGPCRIVLYSVHSYEDGPCRIVRSEGTPETHVYTSEIDSDDDNGNRKQFRRCTHDFPDSLKSHDDNGHRILFFPMYT